jgi:hypothetical protein
MKHPVLHRISPEILSLDKMKYIRLEHFGNPPRSMTNDH